MSGNGLADPLDTYADDLAALVQALNLKGRGSRRALHGRWRGHPLYRTQRHEASRHGVLVSAIPPLTLKTAADPAGTPVEASDELRAATLADRSPFLKDLSAPFYGRHGF